VLRLLRLLDTSMVAPARLRALLTELRGEAGLLADAQCRALPQVWRGVGTAFGQSGTLVVWSKLDRIMWRTAASIIDNSEFLVGRMYRRFLNSGAVAIGMVSFDVDSPVLTATPRDVMPNDPGYLMERTSCPAPFETTPMFEPWPGAEHSQIKHKVRFRGKEHIVTIRFSIATKAARLGNHPGALPHGKHAERIPASRSCAPAASSTSIRRG